MLDSGLLSGKKLCFYTLGCKLNFAESSAIASELRSYGAVNASKGETADICIVNTCSVTEVADRKGRQAIHKIVKNNPDALVVVTGCYAQLKPLVIENLPGVDIVIGAESKSQVVPQVLAALSNRTEPNVSDSPFFPACSAEDRTRHFLKVQDGCDYFCTYCTIPYARGRSRNGAIADIMSQVRNVAGQGGREIVITGTQRQGRLFYSHKDKELAAQTMKELGISELSDRELTTLSGGQLRRVFIARALCGRPVRGRWRRG